MKSSTPGQNPDSFRHVEEVVLAVVNLAIHWVNIKQQVSTWRLTWDYKLPIGELRQCASLQKNHCDPFSEGTPTLHPLLPKTNLTIQGWLTADSSRPFPIANLTCLTRRWGVWYYWLFSRHCYKMHLQCQVSKTVFLRSCRIPRSQDFADFVLGCW